MAINTRSQGLVIVVCKNCGAVLHEYKLGDPKNKSKFGGVPDPTKIALSKGGICEVCGSPILSRPQDILFMTMKKFEKSFNIVTVEARTGKRVKMLKVVDIVAPAAMSTAAGAGMIEDAVQAPSSPIGAASVETDNPLP